MHAAGRPGRSRGDLTGLTRFADATLVWLEGLDDLVEQGLRSPGTAAAYRRQLQNHVLPALGEMRLGKITTPALDRLLNGIRRKVSGASARSCRFVISGVMGSAVRHGVVTVNPVREAQVISAHVRPEYHGP
ncbi:phage integrase central domain-containing protein [Nocardioides agariphilus]|uniref:phage integrase central domain-containing protein n=1 Tax=Nocardioides agariphilus TaxID=433664 RepID=UPI0035201283